MATGRERPHGFRDALAIARRILSANHEVVSRGALDAEIEQLVCGAFRKATGTRLSRMELFTRIEDRYPDEAGSLLMTWAGARAEGKPLQHLLGTQVFLDHEYEVGPQALVPRPETEFLVVTALDWLAKSPNAPTLGLEVGLGSGAISIELLAKHPKLRIRASELTDAAAALAARNARALLGTEGSARLEIVRASAPLEVMEPFGSVEGADFLISNPPYLIQADPIDDEVRAHEPAEALFAPEADPIHFYRRIAQDAPRFLRPGAAAFVEIAPERVTEVLEVFKNAGWDAQVRQDLTGRDRVVSAILPVLAIPGGKKHG